MRYLGLDLGTKTLGVAISDRTGIIASFYDSFRYSSEEELLNRIESIVVKEKIDVIVLGLPKNMNGSLGFRAQDTISFGDKLKSFVNKDVVLQGELYETPDNYVLNESINGTEQTITLSSINNSDYEAEIGNTKYRSLEEAINAVTNSEKTTIKLLKDIIILKSIEIPENINVVID